MRLSLAIMVGATLMSSATMGYIGAYASSLLSLLVLEGP